MANITVSDLYINGTKMPDPALEGVTVNREKIWSSNTGRTTSGKMGRAMRTDGLDESMDVMARV